MSRHHCAGGAERLHLHFTPLSARWGEGLRVMAGQSVSLTERTIASASARHGRPQSSRSAELLARHVERPWQIARVHVAQPKYDAPL